ncbi:S41 family peptidase [Cesiribacter sp. SM1]|uniref:S41 family peptidase n=1 Tax=Cesiribacter sp. SM1 TaxID=2861196 RepID=UPI001CD3EDB0|nr:S41 family peptidase [Cesiribacter sp. SM1]
MSRLILTLCTFLLLLLNTGCEKELLSHETPNSPEQNFEVLWQEFDRMYGTFAVKRIDWQALYNQYRPQVTPTTTDGELFTIMTQLLEPLDDNHIYLRAPRKAGLPDYSGGILGRKQQNDYESNVLDHYLQTKHKYGEAFTWGWLSDGTGYIHIHDFSYDYAYYPKAMDHILGALKEADAIVVDVRENWGGEDRVSQYIANRFASSTSLSFTSRLRNGPGHNDFGPELRFYTRPEGTFQYTKPVMLLTRRATFSSGETFVLAMRQNPNITVVGDTTGGAFSDAIRRELPNGWMYRLPIADVRAADGKNYESIGLAPDVWVKNTREELEAGQDKTLEQALALLE